MDRSRSTESIPDQHSRHYVDTLRVATHPNRQGATMSVLPEVLAANEAYAAAFGQGQLALPPARRSRSSPAWMPASTRRSTRDLSEGDAHVIRNAGGRASDDAIRSLVISYKLLGTHEWFVIHHTDCGMEFFTDEVMRDLLANSLETAALGDDGFYDVGTGPGSAEADYIDWLTIPDQAESVAADVRRIRTHSLVPDQTIRSTGTSTTSRRAAS